MIQLSLKAAEVQWLLARVTELTSHPDFHNRQHRLNFKSRLVDRFYAEFPYRDRYNTHPHSAGAPPPFSRSESALFLEVSCSLYH